MSDKAPKPIRKRALQSPGNLSKVYVPLITKIFRERYRKSASTIIFSLDDVRNACDALNVASRNSADVIYRMRSRTILPPKFLNWGSMYFARLVEANCFEKASSSIFEPPFTEPITTVESINADACAQTATREISGNGRASDTYHRELLPRFGSPNWNDNLPIAFACSQKRARCWSSGVRRDQSVGIWRNPTTKFPLFFQSKLRRSQTHSISVFKSSIWSNMLNTIFQELSRATSRYR